MQLSSPTKVRTPRGFKPVRGLSLVTTIEEPQFARTNGNVKGAKRRGLLYQEKVVEVLDQQLGPYCEGIPGLWFEFVDFSGHRYAQSDWVSFDLKRGLITIAEIKLSRVPLAWWQLNRLYGPLVQKLFPDWKIAYLEVARSPVNVAVPEEVKVVQRLDQAKPGCTSFMMVKDA